jgi:hypothetical protein
MYNRFGVFDFLTAVSRNPESKGFMRVKKIFEIYKIMTNE